MSSSMLTTSTHDHQDNASVISILGLPKGSSLTLDGQTILLQRDDFVGIQAVPTDSDFHFAVARAAACGSKEEQRQGNVAAVSVGFSFETNIGSIQSRYSSSCSSSSVCLLRRYDAMTEEVSSKNVDNATATNLDIQIQNHQIDPQRLIPYENVVSKEHSTSWKALTNFISQRLLRARAIRNGSKIVPGCYGEDKMQSTQQQQQQQPLQEDGISMNYPPIPVLDSDKSDVRHSRHLGTKRYLASLPPSARTSLFLENSPQGVVLESILKRWYGHEWMDLLGDVQLAYILFLHLHCLSSLEHWRDLVAMLSSVNSESIERQLDLYRNLFEVLSRQVTRIEKDFFEDIETSGDNFLVPALQQLCDTARSIPVKRLQEARTHLCQVLENRFGSSFASSSSINNNPQAAGRGTSRRGTMEIEPQNESDCEDDDEEDDMPVVISYEEVEASLARSSLSSPLKPPSNIGPPDQYPASRLQRKYPVLFAAKMDHEDILMTCARALDDATDVSLVREAGTFLVEEVEPDMSDL